jgi:tetratricopeptide (TPR) repeat protein
LTMDITSEGGEPIQKFVCADLAGGTGPGPAGRSPASAPDTGAVEDAMSAGTELSETARRAADAATDAKDWVRAAELWDALRADLPHDPHRWFKAGEAYCEAGMLVDAERILSEAVVLFPDHLWIAHRHMVLPRRNSDWTEALQRAEKLREAAPHFWPAWVESADALAALGHVSQSEERRHQAVERFPDEFWPNYGVAKLTADRGDWAIAVRAWSELLIRFPSEAMASDGLRNSVEAAERKFAEAIDRTDQLEAEVESFRRALRMALTLEPE